MYLGCWRQQNFPSSVDAWPGWPPAEESFPSWQAGDWAPGLPEPQGTDQAGTGETKTEGTSSYVIDYDLLFITTYCNGKILIIF